MTFQLPEIPAAQVKIDLVPNSWVLSSKYGGADQKISRLGSRWVVTVTVRGLSQSDGGEIAAWIAEGAIQKVRYVIPQPKKALANNGAFVTGSGKSITVSGTSPSPGDFFSLSHGGVHYLHRVVTASGGNLTIQPGLKVAATPGDIVYFQTPTIEGFIADEAPGYEFGLTGVVHQTFTIRESQ